MTKDKLNKLEIFKIIKEVHENVKVLEDPKSKAKYFYTPFFFPDGTHGSMILIKGQRSSWKPSADIKSVEINFKPKDWND